MFVGAAIGRPPVYSAPPRAWPCPQRCAVTCGGRTHRDPRRSERLRAHVIISGRTSRIATLVSAANREPAGASVDTVGTRPLDASDSVEVPGYPVVGLCVVRPSLLPLAGACLPRAGRGGGVIVAHASRAWHHHARSWSPRHVHERSLGETRLGQLRPSTGMACGACRRDGVEQSATCDGVAPHVGAGARACRST